MKHERTSTYDLEIPVVILCGGRGTRIRDAADIRPKPMLDIGGRPVLWHIMKLYSHYGFKNFLLPLGYLGDQIKNFFLNYRVLTSDFTLTLGAHNGLKFHDVSDEDGWRITCVDTGENAMTGARIWRVRKFLTGDHFMLTYGDGVADVDIRKLYEFHLSHGRIGTVTGIHPPGRFGDLKIRAGKVAGFKEKRQVTEGLINGGFFLFRRDFVDSYFNDSADLFLEREPLDNLARDGELMLYEHEGFWQCMDTFREWQFLNALWTEQSAPWRVWP